MLLHPNMMQLTRTPPLCEQEKARKGRREPTAQKSSACSGKNKRACNHQRSKPRQSSERLESMAHRDSRAWLRDALLLSAYLTCLLFGGNARATLRSNSDPSTPSSGRLGSKENMVQFVWSTALGCRWPERGTCALQRMAFCA